MCSQHLKTEHILGQRHGREFTVREEGGQAIIETHCAFCGQHQTIQTFYTLCDMVRRIEDWLHFGTFIQDALPDLSDDQRELLISGTCRECFDLMFAHLDQEPQEDL
jgi:hypothetical protein